MKNFEKITITQFIRFWINMVAVLVVLGAIIFGSASTAALQTVAGTLILWFIGDLFTSMYLELLYEREES